MKEKQGEYYGNRFEKVDFGSNDHKSKEEPTTTRKELSKIALKYEQIISERMRERQRMAGGDKVSQKAKSGSDQMVIIGSNTTSRKELAKISNTERTQDGTQQGTADGHDTDTPFYSSMKFVEKIVLTSLVIQTIM